MGVRKSATSWIWKQFTDHPDVYTLPEKEVYFFNKNYKKGLNWYRSKFTTNQGVVLDTTPDYFFKGACDRIKNDLPDAKLLVCLRNPIDRAYSHWKFGCFVGNCSEEFIDAWNKDWNRVRTRGLYDNHLGCYLQHYRLGDSFLALLYDDLQADPLMFVNKIQDYLEVPRRLSGFFDKKWMPGEVSETNTEKDYEAISKRRMSRSDCITLKAYYNNSIINTENILGRDLGHWK